MLQWSFAFSADIVIDDFLPLQLPSQLLDLLLLLVILFSVSISLFSQLHPRSLQCPNVSRHVRVQDGRRNPFFINNFNNYRQDGFVRNSKILGTDSNPSEIWFHRKRSLRAQLMRIIPVDSIPGSYESAALLATIPLEIKDTAWHQQLMRPVPPGRPNWRKAKQGLYVIPP